MFAQHRLHPIIFLSAVLVALFSLCTGEAEENSLKLHGFLIEERAGKYGIVDSDGNTVLPFAYYIPLDQFTPGEEEWCVNVYVYTEPVYTGGYDIDMDLFEGRMKAGFYHLKSRYFSGCLWPHTFISDTYAAVCNDESRWALLDAKTGEMIFGYQYDFIVPLDYEGWVPVWLWPTEYSETVGDWIREAAYVNLDGRTLTAPDGYHFSEEPVEQEIVNGTVLLYADEPPYEAVHMQVDEILRQSGQ